MARRISKVDHSRRPNQILPSTPGLTRFLLPLFLAAALLLSLAPPPAAAQLPDAEVDFFVKAPEAGTPLTVGDHITLRLEVTHPVDSRVVLPQVAQAWESFEVVDQTPLETVDNEDGTVTTGRDIIVTLFEPGQFQTPRLIITHRRPDDAIEELAAPVISLQITSVLTDDTELHDLKPQAELPVPPVWPWVVGGLLLTILLTGLLAGAGLWLHHRWQSRQAAFPVQASTPIIDPRPPEVIAHAELDRIEALHLPAQNRIKEHYILVADCLRAYIEGRYQIPALEQTTAELRAAFRKSPVSMRHCGGFMGILAESDLVKFARYKPAAGEVSTLVNKARSVVDVTTPPPPLPETMAAEPEVKV